MKVKWNNCFLCLNDLTVAINADESTSAPKRRKGRKRIDKSTKCKSIRASSVLLLNYLLDTKCKKYSGVIDNIVKLIESDENKGEAACHDDEVTVKFCGKCESQLKVVSELHQELEVVQMKLVYVLKSVQRTVMQNSKENNCGSNGLEIFEDWLKNQEQQHLDEESSSLIEQRRILNALYSFQAGVIENVKNCIDIPRVYLDKFVHFKDHPIVETSEDSFNAVVKTESVDIDEILNNIAPSPEEPDWFAEYADDDDDELPKLPSVGPKRKTKKKKPVSLATEVKVKSEDDNDNIIPQRKIRSASFVARQCISAGKKEKRRYTKNKTKKEKTEPPRKQRARLLKPFRLPPQLEKKYTFKPGLYWACATCSFKSRSVYCFQYHLRTHEPVVGEQDSSSLPLFHCEKCDNLTFSVKQHYQFHEACHLGAILMSCDFCNASCDAMTLVEHMKTHVEKVFPCPNCYYCSSTREKYLHHLKLHLNSDKHECDLCGKICTSRKLLLNHYHTDHQLLETYICNVDGCTQEFLDPKVLLRHKNNFHLNSFICQHCGRSLASAQSLEVHIISQHATVKPFACEQCSETFCRKESLKRHMISQHQAPKLKCKYCGKEYGGKPSLKTHIAQFHTGSEFVCDYPECGRMFGNGTLLRRHKVLHSGERKFSCEECGKTFKFIQGLKKHRLIHFGEKKFKCQYCEKTFLFEKYLTQHLRIHTGEKPFVCDHCGTAFNQYAALYMHKRNCHIRN